MKNEFKFLIALLSLVMVATLCRNFPTNNSGNESAPPEEPIDASDEQAATPTFTIVPSDTPEPSFTPTLEDGVIPGRCEIFEDIEMKFMVYDMTTEDTTMTMYVRMVGGVPGLEITIPGDPGPFEYHATLGALESVSCGFEGYAERLFCYFALHPSYHNTAQPFDLYVNGCLEPIYGHPRLSIISMTPTPGVVADPCGPMPSTSACSTDYSDWCACKGGIYHCMLLGPPFFGSIPMCILPPSP